VYCSRDHTRAARSSGWCCGRWVTCRYFFVRKVLLFKYSYAFIGLPGQALSADDRMYRAATTACLSAIVVMQVMNVHLCRTRRRSVFSERLSGNPLITAGIVVELILIVLIDYTPAGNAVFGTAPLPLSVWAFVVPFAIGMLGLEEVRKAVVRRRATGAQVTT